MNSNYSITNAPLTNPSRSTALGKSRNYLCPSANILAAILPNAIFTPIYSGPLRGRKCKRKKGSCNAINKAGKQPLKSPLFCYCAIAIVVRPGALANLPSRIARHHRPTAIARFFFFLSFPFSSFFHGRGHEGWFPRKNEGKENRKKKENVRGKRSERKGTREGIEETEREQDFYIKCHDSATLTGETMWRCLKYCPTLRYQTRWRGGRKKWKGKEKKRRKRRERERTMRRERERKREVVALIVTTWRFATKSSKKIIQPNT